MSKYVPHSYIRYRCYIIYIYSKCEVDNLDSNLDLNLVQSQKILLTPKLKQALEILRMNSQELFEYIEEQLESNPVLDILENNYSTEEMILKKYRNKKTHGLNAETLCNEDVDSIKEYELEELAFNISLYESIQFIIPDVIIKKAQHKFQVILNEDAIPLVNINEAYRKILSSDVNSELKKVIHEKIDAATWILWCIEQRKNTILKVTELILSKEFDFFDKGKRYLKFLALKELAEELDIHETVIQNTLNGKYIQCQWGVFEMKSFIDFKSQ
jgi:DNA-directed RNA polymerase specialized sigma54-like protein